MLPVHSTPKWPAMINYFNLPYLINATSWLYTTGNGARPSPRPHPPTTTTLHNSSLVSPNLHTHSYEHSYVKYKKVQDAGNVERILRFSRLMNSFHRGASQGRASL